jgi:hypothetical protein
MTLREILEAARPAPRVTGQLGRKTFSVSRLAEFASSAELVKATGHPVERWPLVVVKEVVDNALDAAEEASVAPRIAVLVDQSAITIADQGPGINLSARVLAVLATNPSETWDSAVRAIVERERS